MERITEHQLRVIRVAIVAFAVFAVIFYSYELGDTLYEMRTNKTSTDFLKSAGLATEPLTKGHQPYEVRSWIATGLFFTVLMNIGLLVAVAKHCKCLMKVWLVQAAVWCVLGVYLTILHTFGSRVPLYGSGALSVLGVILYVCFMGLVAIFHEMGDRLDTVIRTHRFDTPNDSNPEDY